MGSLDCSDWKGEGEMIQYVLSWPLTVWALISLGLGLISLWTLSSHDRKAFEVMTFVILDVLVLPVNIAMSILLLLIELLWLHSHPGDGASLTVVLGFCSLFISPLIGLVAAIFVRSKPNQRNPQPNGGDGGLRKSILRFFRSERGVAYPVFWALILPVLIGVIGLASDLARAQAVQTYLQTATDAAALAAVETAKPVITYGYVPEYDSNGNLVGLQQVVTSDTYEIQDPNSAYQAADAAFNANMSNMMQAQNVVYVQPIDPFPVLPPNPSGEVYSRRTEVIPANNDSYTVWAGAGVQSFFLGPALRLLDPLGPIYRSVILSAVGTASIGQPVQPGP